MENINTELYRDVVSIIAIISTFIAILLFIKLLNIKHRLNNVVEILDDISQGNNNHKILASPNDITTSICYKINEIVHNYCEQIIFLKKANQANRELITSLSHDVRTPLTTLIGYLDASQKGIVLGEEREQYIEIARTKSHDMKEYIDKLFEWFKLNSNDEIFIIEKVELSELTRDILKNWIPIFEDYEMNYDIDIPEKQTFICVDIEAYSRILNNLIQNVIYHSSASYIEISIVLQDLNVTVTVNDNGKGISKQDLPYIFDRLYKCDKSRSQKGSGLGLSIVKHLVQKMGGNIMVQSEPNKKTSFCMWFPLFK